MQKSVSWEKQVHSCSSEDAVEAYLMLRKELQVQGFTQTQTFPPWAEKLTSHGLRQVGPIQHNLDSNYFFIFLT